MWVNTAHYHWGTLKTVDCLIQDKTDNRRNKALPRWKPFFNWAPDKTWEAIVCPLPTTAGYWTVSADVFPIHLELVKVYCSPVSVLQAKWQGRTITSRYLATEINLASILNNVDWTYLTHRWNLNANHMCICSIWFLFLVSHIRLLTRQ